MQRTRQPTTGLSNASSVVEAGNIELEISELSNYFVDATGYNLRLIDGSPAIDAGSNMAPPAVDRDGISRPQGNGIDVGAYEWHDGSANPNGGAAGAGDGVASGGTAADSGSASGVASQAGQAGSGNSSSSIAGSSAGGTRQSATEDGSEDPAGAASCSCSSPGHLKPARGEMALLLVGLAWCVRRRSDRQAFIRH